MKQILALANVKIFLVPISVKRIPDPYTFISINFVFKFYKNVNLISHKSSLRIHLLLKLRLRGTKSTCFLKFKYQIQHYENTGTMTTFDSKYKKLRIKHTFFLILKVKSTEKLII